MGETTNVECIIDNTKCEKDLKTVTLKLKRLIHAKAKDGFKYKTNDTLIKVKAQGIAAG